MNYKENKKLILELIDCKRKGEILESKNYGKYKILGKTKKISKSKNVFLTETIFEFDTNNLDAF